MRELKHNITLLFIDFTFIFKKLPEAFFVKIVFSAVNFFFFFFFSSKKLQNMYLSTKLMIIYQDIPLPVHYHEHSLF